MLVSMEGLARGRPQESKRVFTVSELNQVLKDLLEETFPFLWVEGEVANLRSSKAGHLYFSLRDDGASLKAVLFKSYRLGLPFGLEEGLHVLCFGRLSLYEPRGEYQLLVQQVEPMGLGAFRLALSQLKAKLAREGLLDEALKRPLPAFPRAIGLITSLHGAAVHDFLKLGLSRHPRARVIIYPVRVQGEEAVGEILEGLRVLAGLEEVEVIVITRGGGSLEDLWPFNNEALARAIRATPVPVVSAVGHEIDYTLCDLVADARAPTPSAAAELVFPDLSALGEGLALLKVRLERAVKGHLFLKKERLTSLARRLRDPRRALKERQRELNALGRRLYLSGANLLSRKRETLKALAARLEALSPLAVLSRGYSLVYKLPERSLVRSASQVREGEGLEILTAEGWIKARVEGKSP